MPTNTGGGTTTSLNNTPQAKADTFGLGEDQSTPTYFDVMLNDLGGNAKILWSVDDGSSSSDLIASDIGKVEACSTDRSAHGAKIWVENGLVGYDAGTLDASYKLSLQALAVGETATDTFTYAIRMSNGTLSWSTVTVVYTGTNDVPVITSAAQSGAVREDVTLTACGQVTSSDVDHNATAAYTGNASGTYGSFVVNSSTGQWTYTLNNGAPNVQALADGQTVCETFTVTVTDEWGATTTQTVKVTITGTNDGPQIVPGGTIMGGVTEDSGTYSASGSFGFTDVDSTDTHSVSVTPDHSGYLGTLTANVSDDSTTDGSGTVGWSFSVADADLQALAQDETITQTYTVTVSDGHGGLTTETVTINLTGVNDGPVAHGDVNGLDAVTESGVHPGDTSFPGDASATGNVLPNDTDVDHGAVLSVAAVEGSTTNVGASVGGTYGSVTIGTNGVWTYTLDNGDSDTNKLAQGETATETFHYTVTDEHGATSSATLTIAITGTNDAPVIDGGASDLSGALSENALDDVTPAQNASVAGQVVFSDVDHGDTPAASVDASAATLVYTPDGDSTSSALPPGLDADAIKGAFSIIDPATGEWSFDGSALDLEALGSGDSITLTYTVTVTDDYGATDDVPVTITITGTNDAPVIDVGASGLSGALSENAADDDTPAQNASVAGQVVFSDVDHGDSPAASVDTSVASLVYTADGASDPSDLPDGLDAEAIKDAFSLNPATGEWSFDGSALDLEALGSGDTIRLTYTVTVTDDDDATDEVTVTITITGTNDAPVAHADGNAGEGGDAVTESGVGPGDVAFGGDASAAGNVLANDTDVDHAAILSVAAVEGDADNVGASVAGTYGSVSIGEHGEWTYSLDNTDPQTQALKQGQVVTETFQYTVTDEHGATSSATLTITITGTNDSPIAAGDVNGLDSVTESGVNPGNTAFGGDASAAGNVLANDTDVDVDHVLTVAAVAGDADNVGASVAGTYGSVTIGEHGDWTYSLDNTDPQTQALKQGETATETFQYTVTDEHGATSTATLTITITGTNDAPVIEEATSVLSGALSENGPDDVTPAQNASVAGQVVFSDVDHGDSPAASVDTSVASLVYTADGASDPSDLPDGLDAEAIKDAFSLNPATGEWSFDGSGLDLEALGSNDTITLTYTVTVTDDEHATDDVAVTITITGTNDAPVATADVNGLDAVTESGVSPGNTSFPGDGSATGNVLANDTDVDHGAVLSVAAVEGSTANVGAAIEGTYGSVTIGADGQWTYTLNNGDDDTDKLAQGDTATETFHYTVSDEHGGTDTATLTITVTGTNDAPVANGDVNGADVVTESGVHPGNTAFPGDGLATGNVLTNDTDVDQGAMLTVAAVEGDAGNVGAAIEGTYGSVTIGEDGQWTYTLNNGDEDTDKLGEGQTATETFHYTVSDEHGGTDTATLTITVTGTNDAPEAAPTNSVTTSEDTASLATAIGATDRDAGDTLAYEVKTGGEPAHGSVTFNQAAGTFVYTPDGDYNGEDSFTIVVTDADGATTEQVVSVTVTAVNDLPSAANDTATTNEDTAVTLSAADLLVNDTDVDIATNGQTLAITAVTDGANGTAALNSDGSITYTPNANFNGTDTITYTISDGNGGTDTAQVIITVTPVNDAPVGVNDGYETAEDTALTIPALGVLANDSDVDGDALTSILVTGPAHGSLVLNADGSFTYTPDANYNGDDSFTYTPNDGTTDGNTVTVNLTVTAVNDAPVITSNGAGDTASVSVAENATVVTTVTATDVENATITYSIAGGADASLFSINSVTGALTFVTAPNFEYPTDSDGDNVYDVVVKASDGSLVDTQTLAVTVTNVNESPTITSDGGLADAYLSVQENTSAVTTVTATDPESSTITYSIVGGPDHALFTIDPSTGALSFVNAPDFEASQDFSHNNLYEVIVQASDGSSTPDTQLIHITVTDVNEPPEIISNHEGDEDTVTVAENTTAVTTVEAADWDAGSVITYSIAGGADSGKFTIDSATGVLTFVSAPDFESPTDADGDNVYDVVVQASDGTLVDNQTLHVTVTDVNAAPEITSGDGADSVTVSVAENSTLVTTIAATDDGEDTGTLTYAIVGGADAGKFTINTVTGALSFLPAPDFESPTDAGGNNVYDVTVQASDGSLTDTQTITVNVTDVVEGPTTVADNVITNINLGTDIVIPEWALLANDVPVVNAANMDVAGVIPLGTDSAVHTPGVGTAGFVTFTDSAPAGGSFNYAATEGGADGNLATVNVTRDAAGAIDGTGGSDIIVSSNGGAILKGNAGNDILIGGSGNDTYQFGLNDGSDIISDGGSGNDKIEIITANPPNSTSISTFNFERVANDLVIDVGSTHIVVRGHFVAGSSVENISFTNGGTVFGYALSTGSYNISTDVTDPLAGTGNADLIASAAIGETLTGGNGNDLLFGNGGVDNIDGGAGNDLIFGGTGDDTLSGGADNDTIVGGDGFDTLQGNAGDDTYVVDLNDGGAWITEASGNDKILIATDAGTVLSSLNFASTVDGNLLIGVGASQITVGGHFNFAGMNVENIAFTNGGSIYGYSLGTSNYALSTDWINPLAGTTGQDVLSGSGSADTISGNSGNDLLFGNGGIDTINGDAGNDLIFGGDGADILNGGTENDTIVGGAGADNLTGGSGNDTFVLTDAATFDTITDYASGEAIDIAALFPVGFDFISSNYNVRFTASGDVQIDFDGGANSFVTVAHINTAVSGVHLTAGAGVDIFVGRSAPPICIDVDGDGHVSFIGTGAGALFDYGAGKVATAWVAGNDGILVRDANHDGQASASEIVFATTGSDLEGLAVYDTNHDGQLSSADAGFSDFQVWQDANSNGSVDAGEMQSLTALGIASISLTSDGIGYTAADGDVQVVGTGSFTRADGSTGVLADAVFATGKAADEQVRVAATLNTNVALLGAVAAAGLASMPAHAMQIDTSDLHSNGHFVRAPEVSVQALAIDSAEANHALANESAVSLAGSQLPQAMHGPGPVSATPGDHSSPFNAQSAIQHVTDLLHATESPHAAAAVETHSMADSASPVSAEMLMAAMAGVAQHGSEKPVAAVAAESHAAELGHVLADALAGGTHGRADIDSLLNAAAGHDQGHFQVAHALTMGAPGEAFAGHFGVQTPILEALMFHPEAPPPA